jgi:hypothetical protein
MGTRADFYGDDMAWLGSISFDGYEVGKAIPAATDEASYREAVAAFLAGRRDQTLPEEGWPWPWNTSATTDRAYRFDAEHGLLVSVFGREWIKYVSETEDAPDEDDSEVQSFGLPEFPEMETGSRQHIMAKSGMIFLTSTGGGITVSSGAQIVQPERYVAPKVQPGDYSVPLRQDPKVTAALAIIERSAGVDGSHHKDWVIDQVVRALTGDDYEAWVTAYMDGDEGPETYTWEEGIAP